MKHTPAERPFARPLSPHLQIYRPMLTMMMSIAHRLSGGALYLGLAGAAGWLWALAAGPRSYAAAQGLIASPPGQVILFAFTWALMHHMLGGLRHFLWDTGRGFGPASIEWLARATLAGGLLLALGLWGLAWAAAGR